MITIINEINSEKLTQQIEEKMTEVAKFAINREGLPASIVDITIVDNAAIREVNLEQRDVDAPTDVLSFPLNSFDGTELETDPESGMLMLGDIMISIERAEEQAAEYGHSLLREMCFLTVHGMLHLMGYDHMDALDERIMFEKQDSILDALGITRE